jgi:hypothetical protein
MYHLLRKCLTVIIVVALSIMQRGCCSLLRLCFSLYIIFSLLLRRIPRAPSFCFVYLLMISSYHNDLISCLVKFFFYSFFKQKIKVKKSFVLSTRFYQFLAHSFLLSHYLCLFHFVH